METNEIKELVQKRIKFVKEMIANGKEQVKKPYTQQHWTGYLAALEGQVGELQFLEKLDKEL